MLLTKNLKAGILLYTLLMTSVFSLILAAYTHRLKAAYQIQKAQLLSSQSYVLAELAKPLAIHLEGQLHFDKGEVAYRYQGKVLEMRVTSGHKTFYYRFLKEEPSVTPEKTNSDSKVKNPSSSV